MANADQPLLDYYNKSDMVLAGKIISLSQVPTITNSSSQYPNQTRYDIQVEQYYKNPQSAKLVTVYGYAKGIYYSQDPTYDLGDRVFLYLKKENGYYQIESPSLRLQNNCDARPMIPMPTLPFEPPPISTPASDRVIVITDYKGDQSDYFRTGDQVLIKFNAENYMPITKHATVDMSVTSDNNTKVVFRDTKGNVTIPECNGNVPVYWSFTPHQPGSYNVWVNVTGTFDIGSTGIISQDPSVGYGFVVRDNLSGAKLDKVHLSPLQQFKYGIAAKDVVCTNGLTLVIKAEDGSPACVTSKTAIVLVERGWGAYTKTFSSLGPDPFPSSTLNRLVFFIKSNSTAQIYVQYSSSLENNGTIPTEGQFYTGNPYSFVPLNSSQITISSSPEKIPINKGSNTTVIYTISVKNATGGLYWMTLTQICGVMPVAIDMGESHIHPSDIPVYMQHCGALYMDVKILGISNGAAKYMLSQELQ